MAKLANERLVVTNKAKEGGETVELVHEALIRHWTQLQFWLEQDREFLTWRLGLRVDLKQWGEANHDEGGLLRGVPLAIARERLSERPGDLTLPERNFIQASIALQEKEAAEKEVLHPKPDKRYCERNAYAVSKSQIALAGLANPQDLGIGQSPGAFRDLLNFGRRYKGIEYMGFDEGLFRCLNRASAI